MNNTFKTLGISLILLINILSANTVFADSDNQTDPSTPAESVSSDIALKYPKNVEQHDLFCDTDSDDDYDYEKVFIKDGKTADINWMNNVEEDDLPEGERTVYFYLSDPYKEENKIYSYDYQDPITHYIGKADYYDLHYHIEDLEPGRYYRLYMIVIFNGGVEDNYYVNFSTNPRNPGLALTQIKNDSVKLYADNGNYYEEEGWYHFDNCLKPDGFEYYKKVNNGKYKKIGTVPIGKSVIDKNLSVGKTYTYKARAYATIDGKKFYSGFSSVEKIKLYNIKPVLKIKFVDKKNKIVKITSDKYNDEIEFGDYDPTDLRHGYNRKSFNKGKIIIEPGKTVYVKLLKKKVKKVNLYSYTTDYYSLTLDFNKCTSKLTKQ